MPRLKSVAPKAPKEVKAAKDDVVLQIEKMGKMIDSLEKRVQALQDSVVVNLKKPEGKSINKLEDFNGEVEPEKKEDNMRMGYADKLVSLRNALAILPPNLIANGRHTAKNAGAICGFIVSEEMLDEVYSTFSHED